MSSGEELLMILGMMAVTFGVRYPVLALAGRIKLPPLLERALSFVPVAVLSAISVPIMLAPQGEVWLSISNEYLIAGIVSILTAAFSRHLLLTILVGMGLFLLLRLI